MVEMKLQQQLNNCFMWVSLCFYDNLKLKQKFKGFGVEKKASRSEVVCSKKPIHNEHLRVKVN